jgi:hypothetical protein
MTTTSLRAAGLALTGFVLAWLPAARAQEAPPGPPPPSSSRTGSGGPAIELLPEIGKIGAQVGLMAGASWNPYSVGRGLQGGGYIDLPLASVAGGRLSYEILLGLSHAESDPFVITDSVALVANLAAGASFNAALAGPPAAPFPVRRLVRTRLRLLQVSPFGLRYTVKSLDHLRLRPYLAAGVDFTVSITRETPEADESLLFRGGAPFDDPLIGGLIAQAPELTARGYPTGQGNIELGAHGGGGVEVRLTRLLSVNLDYRFTWIDGANGRLHSVSSALGFHW